MPKTLRDYAYGGLMGLAAVLVIVGAVMFHGAGSFQGYIGALLVLALAAVAFLGAHELNPAGLTAAIDRLVGKKTEQKDAKTEPF
jgi:hypothetical protein